MAIATPAVKREHAMKAHTRAFSKMPLLKAFFIATVALLLVFLIFTGGVWRYTQKIVSREEFLVVTVLPELDVAQRLTASTSLLQSKSLLLRTANSSADLRVKRILLNDSIEATESILATEGESWKWLDARLVSLLSLVKETALQLSDLKDQELALNQHADLEQLHILEALDEINTLIQIRVAELTKQLLLGSDALRLFAETPDSVFTEKYQQSVSTFEANSLSIQDYLLLSQDVVSVKALIERVFLLPALPEVLLAMQKRDLLLRSMVSRVIYISEADSKNSLLPPLTQIRTDLRADDNLFSDRMEFLSLEKNQIELAELMAETMSGVIQAAENTRFETEAALVSTSSDTLADIIRYRWFLGVLLLLAILVLGMINYWLLYRRTVLPLVAITSQLENVGSPEYKPLKESYFIQEMDELAKAVRELDSVQKIMRQKDIELEGRNLELARANDDLGQFAHVASHDLQEPLRKLQQFSGLLQQEYGDSLDGDGEFYIDAITKSSQRMSLMIRDTLEYARTSRADQHREPVDLQQVIVALRVELDMLIRDSGAVITVEPLPTVTASATGVSQLFRNLLANSMKYRREEVGSLISIRKRLSADKRTIIIDFEDNGVGIKSEYLERVFRPFERLSSNAVKGTGLGLAICQKVCEAHSWKISVDSEDGVRTCFSISIPQSHLATNAAKTSS